MTLRIQRSVEAETVVFTLTGRIQVDRVRELLGFLKAEAPTHRIVLDLEHVKLVDRDAVLFLALCEARGVKLRGCSPYIRKWIEQERNAGQSGSEDPLRSEE